MPLDPHVLVDMHMGAAAFAESSLLPACAGIGKDMPLTIRPFTGDVRTSFVSFRPNKIAISVI